MSTTTDKSAHTPEPWSYSIYRAALRHEGRTVALVSPDGRNAFTEVQARYLVAALNKLTPEQSAETAAALMEGRA